MVKSLLSSLSESSRSIKLRIVYSFLKMYSNVFVGFVKVL